MLILKKLMDAPLSSALIFKGGTALRLAYGSPRFSDDLDFSTIAPIASEAFIETAKDIAEVSPQIHLHEALSKRFTRFALYKIKEPYLPFAFSIKLEVSTRSERWEQGKDFTLQLLTSPVTSLSALTHVATLERLWKDKLATWRDRRQPRDLYDLWFIAQKLNRPFTPDLKGVKTKTLRRELRKYLPRHHWQVIESWIASNQKT